MLKLPSSVSNHTLLFYSTMGMKLDCRKWKERPVMKWLPHLSIIHIFYWPNSHEARKTRYAIGGGTVVFKRYPTAYFRWISTLFIGKPTAELKLQSIRHFNK